MAYIYGHFVNIWFLAVVIISLMNIGVAIFILFEELFICEGLTGWLLSFFNHVTQWIIGRINRIKGASQFFMQCFGLNGLRAGILLLAVVFFLLLTDLNAAAFVYSLFSTYFIFSLYNILNMYFSSIKAGD